MKLRFAVFGDVHGRVALMLTLARRWQQHTGLRLDGLLQVGDMGAFPDHHRLDASTLRFARDDPDELGFVDFLGPTPDGEALLAPADSPPIVFCRGNHEDFAYLGAFARPTPLDPWRKLWFLPDGAVLDWETVRPGPPCRIAALGGAAPIPAPADRGRTARKARRKAAQRELVLGMGPRFRSEDVDRALRRDPGAVDVLLTHAGPSHPAWDEGSDDLARLARRWRPRAHLFGHHHRVVGPVETDDGLLVGLEHLEFHRDRVRDGSWGILALDGGSARFDWVLGRDHRWLAETTRAGWRFG